MDTTAIFTYDFIIPVAIDVRRTSGSVTNSQFRNHGFYLSDLSTFLISGQFAGTAEVSSDVGCNK